MKYMAKRANALLYFLDNDHSRLGGFDNNTTLDKIRNVIEVGCQVDVLLENDYLMSDDCFFVTGLLVTVPKIINLETIIAVTFLQPQNISKFSDAKNVLLLEWN